MNSKEFRKKYSNLIEESRKKALQICADYEEWANDLGEFDENLVVSEKEKWLKDNEERHANWLYLNIK